MTAVTTQSQAWVTAAGIAAVVIPLYFAFIFREFVLCRLSETFAWKRIAQAFSREARMSTAPDSTLPPESGASPFFMDAIEWRFPDDCR